MATKCVLNKSTLTGIADAIRAKGGTTETMLPSQMAAKIEAIPSGGDANETFRKYVLKDIEEIDMAEILGYDSTDPVVNVNQRFLDGFLSIRRFYAPMIGATNYMFNGCVNLSDITVRGVPNNTVPGWASCTNLSNLTITKQNSSTVIGYTSFLSTFPQGCTIHCADKDIKYINGAWTIVERS